MRQADYIYELLVTLLTTRFEFPEPGHPWRTVVRPGLANGIWEEALVLLAHALQSGACPLKKPIKKADSASSLASRLLHDRLKNDRRMNGDSVWAEQEKMRLAVGDDGDKKLAALLAARSLILLRGDSTEEIDKEVKIRVRQIQVLRSHRDGRLDLNSLSPQLLKDLGLWDELQKIA